MLWPDRYSITWKIRLLHRLMLQLPLCMQSMLWTYICSRRRFPH
jgi:hypothetical protein